MSGGGRTPVRKSGTFGGMLAYPLPAAVTLDASFVADLKEFALATFESLSIAAFVVDERGAVRELNGSARALIEQQRHVRVVFGALQVGGTKYNT